MVVLPANLYLYDRYEPLQPFSILMDARLVSCIMVGRKKTTWSLRLRRVAFLSSAPSARGLVYLILRGTLVPGLATVLPRKGNILTLSLWDTLGQMGGQAGHSLSRLASCTGWSVEEALMIPLTVPLTGREKKGKKTHKILRGETKHITEKEEKNWRQRRMRVAWAIPIEPQMT